MPPRPDLASPTTVLYIKHMVCARGIRVVRQELEGLGLQVLDVRLGAATVAGTAEAAGLAPPTGHAGSGSVCAARNLAPDAGGTSERSGKPAAARNRRKVCGTGPLGRPWRRSWAVAIGAAQRRLCPAG